jgi:predicted nucleic acid-binding protein
VSTEGWVDIGLEMGPREEGAPGRVVLHLLRPREWAEANLAREGESIALALRELHIEGSARVTSVRSAPALSAGSRCPVTGTIRRTGVSVIALELERGAPMELTANHRVFSATRNGWVAAGDLQAGEVLQAQEGTVRVRSVHESARGLTSVYNLEVYARHEFFVGEAGVRVHNGYGSVAGGAGRASVALNTNALIATVERGHSILGGRAPVVPITVAKEFLRGGGSSAALREFLTANGGRIGLAGSEATAAGLRHQAAGLGRALHLGDSRVAAGAMREGIPLITNDRKFGNFLRAIGYPVEGF